MNKLTYWIKNHQVIAFFIITFAITWGLGFSYGAVMNRAIFLLAPLVFVATCGPAPAGIIVSTVCNTQPKQGSERTYWIAFLVAWIVSTLVFLANNTFINHAPFSLVMVGFALVSVVPVAFVISMAYSRIPAVKSHLFSLIQLRGTWGWLLLALLVITALNVLSIVISNLLGRQSVPLSAPSFLRSTLIKMVVITFFYQIFFFNLTGEEIGWRGFALPRLQARASPLVASLVLTFFWAMWHVFYWQAGGEPIFTWQFWQETFVELFPATVIINWFYTRSKGSILVAGVTHAAANTVMQYMPGFDWPVHTMTMYAFALVVILIDRMWKKLPTDHPAVYQEPQLDG